MEIPDSVLVRRCLGGEEEAFRILVTRHQSAVYSLILRMVRNREDARDLTQETFIRVFGSLDRFDQERNFSFWLTRIAANRTIDFLRRRKMSTVSLDGDFDDRSGEGSPGPQIKDGHDLQDQQLDASRRRERLLRLIGELPVNHRVVLLLRYLQQLSYEEIASLLDLPLGTVKARLSRAHQQIREWIEERGKGSAADWAGL
jgi:RNA polymerase sigma factor (sigma-70 family)